NEVVISIPAPRLLPLPRIEANSSGRCSSCSKFIVSLTPGPNGSRTFARQWVSSTTSKSSAPGIRVAICAGSLMISQTRSRGASNSLVPSTFIRSRLRGRPHRQQGPDHIQRRLTGGIFSAVAGFDAVFVGAGVNSLTGAALLSRAGWSVCVLERNEVLGGAIRTSGDLTAPGFTHELMASWHPLFAGSAAYAELGDDLHRHGLEYLNTDLPTATLFPDGGAAFLTTSLDDNIAEFDRHAAGDGAAWQRQFETFMASAEHSFGVLSAELWSTQGLNLARKAYGTFGRRGLLGFAGSTLVSARDWVGATFASERAHGLLAPWVLHTGLGPEQALSGFMTQVIACAIQLGGMPVPRGGGVRLVEALAGIVREGGGELRTGAHVERVLVAGGRATGVRLAGGETVGGPRAARRVWGRRDGRTLARGDRGRHAPAALRRAPERGRGPAGGLAIGTGLSLRPRRHADPPRAGRAATVGVARGRASRAHGPAARDARAGRRLTGRQRGRAWPAAGRGDDRRRPA